MGAEQVSGVADLRAKVREASIAVEAALVAAETLASHGVVESINYERLMDLLSEAQKAVAALEESLSGGEAS
jgi:uncharacterized membrane protein (Fun14 family)